MKTILPLITGTALLLFLAIAPRTATAADPPYIKTIKAADLKTANGAKAQAPDNITKGKTYQVYLQFKDNATAKANAAHYQVSKADALVAGQVKDNTVYFDFGDPFKSISATALTFKVIYTKDKKKPKVTECLYQYVLNLGDAAAGGKTPDDATKKEPAVDYIAIAKDLKFSINLNDLYTDQGCCCVPDIYPCFGDKSLISVINLIKNRKADEKLDDKITDNIPKNRLIYDAKANDTYWFDAAGTPTVLSTKDKKYFTVQAGNPIAFEIINVNPAAYKLSIKDTTVSYFQDSNDLLAKFLSPFNTSSSSGTAASATADEKAVPDPKTVRINIVRAGIVTIDAALNDFTLNQAYTCDNLFFKLIDNKIQAKKRIDQFLMADPLKKPAAMTLDQFMHNELNISKEDSTLYKVTTQFYNALPSTPYHMEYLTRAQFDKDRIDFKYSILARDKTPYIDKAVNETIPVYIVGNFKVDVSTGLYYSPWLRNDVYTLHADSDIVTKGTKTDTVRGKRIINDRRNLGEFGFSAYLHFYKKSTPDFSWGGHIGVGVSLDDQVKPRYFTGFSFLFGRESGRIALNIGVAMGNVDRISNEYSKGGNNPASSYVLIPSSETDIKYISKFSIAPAIGISYNIPFSLAKKTQTATTDDSSTKAAAPAAATPKTK